MFLALSAGIQQPLEGAPQASTLAGCGWARATRFSIPARLSRTQVQWNPRTATGAALKSPVPITQITCDEDHLRRRTECRVTEQRSGPLAFVKQHLGFDRGPGVPERLRTPSGSR